MELVADFPKLDRAKGQLEHLRRQFELCSRLCNLDQSEQACFYYNIRQCRGACIAEENVEEYNARADEAIIAVRRHLSGSFVIMEKGRTPGEQAAIVVVDGHYRGYTYLDANLDAIMPEDLLEMAAPAVKDPEAPRIIHNYLESDLRSKRGASLIKY